MSGTRLRSPARPRAPRSLTALAASGALLGLLLGLCVFAPARWLAWAAAHSGALALESPRGTLWNGSAQLWLVGGAGSPDRAALPERVRWQLQPDWGGLRLSLSADCCLPQPLQMRLGWSAGAPSLTVSDSVSDWPAQTLVGLGTPWNTLQPAGRMVLQTRGLGLRWSQQRLHVTGSASLQLQDLSSALSTLQPMGSYQLNLSAGPGAQLTLSTLRGDLLLSGNGSWTEQGLRFRGEARAAPGREDALANLLNIVGKREGARTLISLG